MSLRNRRGGSDDGKHQGEDTGTKDIDPVYRQLEEKIEGKHNETLEAIVRLEEKLTQIQEKDGLKDQIERRVKDSSLYHSGTIHSYAIAAVTEKSTSRTAAAGWAMLSLLVPLLQALVLFFFARETTNPTCSAHTDCPTGLFCSTSDRWYNQPTCTFCENVKGDLVRNCNVEGLISIEGDVDHSTLWFNKDSVPHYNKEEELDCLIWKHCQNSQMYTENGTTDEEGRGYYIDQCDFLLLVTSKVSWMQQLIFVFLVLLFALHICKDIEEAAIEEAILHHRRSKENRTVNILYWVVLLSLRYRRHILPFLVSAATITITLSDDLSVKNILLNIVALEFVTHTHNLLGGLVLKRSLRQGSGSQMEDVVKDAVLHDVTISFWGTRIAGIFSSIVTIMIVLNGSLLLPSCDGLFMVLVVIATWLPVVPMLIHSFCVVSFSKKSHPSSPAAAATNDLELNVIDEEEERIYHKPPVEEERRTFCATMALFIFELSLNVMAININGLVALFSLYGAVPGAFVYNNATILSSKLFTAGMIISFLICLILAYRNEVAFWIRLRFVRS